MDDCFLSSRRERDEGGQHEQNGTKLVSDGSCKKKEANADETYRSSSWSSHKTYLAEKKKKERQRVDNPGREGEEGALTVLVAQRRFDGSDRADAEMEEINVIQYSQHVQNTLCAFRDSFLCAPSPRPSSDPQFATDLFRRKQWKEWAPEIPQVNLECSLFVSCVV
ncbi:uncharacterized protein MONOS_4623 [Monocercomonoides exilis]|uniref:uncharacterized protein n=1 Tax=Monocercomonoides exilis TaxID=2049356 RepID=UPI00355A12DD|nr:hypothetical protein MONOS_4623 [Monocercomonoides exilis]|eukprot:MONOS_4623.1-p1 / transcript=MONOS_4623.1 / gene=MONOS_4623 / organism=Monocercomonoides_exilis_PA203 / gene_product=unspecified product / transcript_product=unspecified product / location=Mono_scaffold00125:7922-8538(+) / protein_length=166 / sequence_SO=supercontig / SO=protein_coding / is_pseudo=false